MARLRARVSARVWGSYLLREGHEGQGVKVDVRAKLLRHRVVLVVVGAPPAAGPAAAHAVEHDLGRGGGGSGRVSVRVMGRGMGMGRGRGRGRGGDRDRGRVKELLY